MMDDKANIVLLDVRTPMETARGIIKGAKLMPMSELQARAKELPKDRDIIVYCAVGNRSAAATRMLNGMGFDKAKNMTDGYSKWKRL
jgi:rhodanese-related sulfurtransferase